MKAFILGLIVVAVAVVVAEGTRCEEHRAIMEKLPIPVKIVPECDENGDYKEIQCHHGGSKFCQCWTKDGRVISAPSTTLKDCECWKHHDEADKTAHVDHEVFKPKCKTDGTYAGKQCQHDASGTEYCWCVDENGKELTARGKPREVTCERE